MKTFARIKESNNYLKLLILHCKKTQNVSKEILKLKHIRYFLLVCCDTISYNIRYQFDDVNYTAVMMRSVSSHRILVILGVHPSAFLLIGVAIADADSHSRLTEILRRMPLLLQPFSFAWVWDWQWATEHRYSEAEALLQPTGSHRTKIFATCQSYSDQLLGM